MNELKMSGPRDASEAIVMSFEAQWAEPIKQQKVHCVFRKRAPRHLTPRLMYIYIGSPLSAIIGRCLIVSIELRKSAHAFALAGQGHISLEKLKQYAAHYDSLAVYTIKPIELCKSPLLYPLLRTTFSFSPPQTFFVLSRRGQAELDTLAGFSQRKSRT